MIASIVSLTIGALGAFGFAPYYILPLYVLSLSYGAYLFTHTKTPLSFAFFFALGFYLNGLWWISNALLVDPQFLWAWPLALLGLPLLFALYFTGIVWLALKLKIVKHWYSFAWLWLLTEYIRGFLFTGFPWNPPAHIWLGSLGLPVAQLAAHIGMWGLSLLTVFWACCLTGVWTQPNRIRKCCLWFTFTTLLWVGGYVRLQNPTLPTDIKIALVQESIAQKDKWDADKSTANIQKLITRTDQALTDIGDAKSLVVWPETALSEYMLDARPDVTRQINNLIKKHPATTLISGYFYHDNGYQNALRIFSRSLNGPIYSKHHLVPFGEYMPFEKFIPIGPLVGFEGFQAGLKTTSLTTPLLPAFTPLVCYEIIFADAQLANADSDWILTVANDAWYGDTPGPYQHLDAARMRAIELGLPVVRAANTGISAVVDSYGRINAAIKYNHNDTVVVPLPQPDKTGFYRIFGQAVFFIFFGIGFAILSTSFVKRT